MGPKKLSQKLSIPVFLYYYLQNVRVCGVGWCYYLVHNYLA